MRQFRRLAALLCALALATPAAGHGSNYSYWKWHRWGDWWVLLPVEECAIACAEHGYEHDENGPIPGHQKGESWDCKYMTLRAAQPLDHVVQAARDHATPVLKAAYEIVSKLPGIATEKPPPCPPLAGVVVAQPDRDCKLPGPVPIGCPTRD